MENPIIDTHDKLCKECITQAGMLCSGVRPYLRKDGRGLVYQKCRKLVALEDTKRYAKKIELSGLPAPIRDAFPEYAKVDVSYDNGVLTVNGSVLQSIKIIKDVKEDTQYKLVASLIKNGVNAKYLYCKIIFRWLEFHKVDLDSMLGKDVEFAWIDYPELVSCPEYLKDKFYTAIETRLVIGLPTYIRVADNIVTENTLDKRFFELINRYK